MKKITLMAALIAFIISCENRETKVATKQKEVVQDTFLSDEERNAFKNPINRDVAVKVLFSGDTNAYRQIQHDFMFSERGTEFLFYAMMMANKYDHAEAYFDVFFILSNPQTFNFTPFEELDKTTQNLALYYLLKSHEKGYKGSKEFIKKRFGDKKIPKSNDYQNIGMKH